MAHQPPAPQVLDRFAIENEDLHRNWQRLEQEEREWLAQLEAEKAFLASNQHKIQECEAKVKEISAKYDPLFNLWQSKFEEHRNGVEKQRKTALDINSLKEELFNARRDYDALVYENKSIAQQVNMMNADKAESAAEKEAVKERVMTMMADLADLRHQLFRVGNSGTGAALSPSSPAAAAGTNGSGGAAAELTAVSAINQFWNHDEWRTHMKSVYDIARELFRRGGGEDDSGSSGPAASTLHSLIEIFSEPSPLQEVRVPAAAAALVSLYEIAIAAAEARVDECMTQAAIPWISASSSSSSSSSCSSSAASPETSNNINKESLDWLRRSVFFRSACRRLIEEGFGGVEAGAVSGGGAASTPNVLFFDWDAAARDIVERWLSTCPEVTDTVRSRLSTCPDTMDLLGQLAFEVVRLSAWIVVADADFELQPPGNRNTNIFSTTRFTSTPVAEAVDGIVPAKAAMVAPVVPLIHSRARAADAAGSAAGGSSSAAGGASSTSSVESTFIRTSGLLDNILIPVVSAPGVPPPEDASSSASARASHSNHRPGGMGPHSSGGPAPAPAPAAPAAAANKSLWGWTGR